MNSFATVLDSADQLSPEEQESLIGVLQRRLTERRRAELVEFVREARREFRQGRCRPASTAQILKRIIS